MIRLLLRLYPHSWRQRYGAELAELVEAMGGLTLTGALDVIGHALRARLRGWLRWVTAGPDGGDWPSFTVPALALAGLVALMPAAVFACFALAFTVLGIPVEPFAPLVRTAFETLPMQHALTLLPAFGLVVAGMPLIIRTRHAPGRLRLEIAWGSSRFACLVAAASAATLLFWAVDRAFSGVL